MFTILSIWTALTAILIIALFLINPRKNRSSISPIFTPYRYTNRIVSSWFNIEPHGTRKSLENIKRYKERTPDPSPLPPVFFRDGRKLKRSKGFTTYQNDLKAKLHKEHLERIKKDLHPERGRRKEASPNSRNRNKKSALSHTYKNR